MRHGDGLGEGQLEADAEPDVEEADIEETDAELGRDPSNKGA